MIEIKFEPWFHRVMNEAIEVLKDEILNKRLCPVKAIRIQEGIAELLIREGSCIEGYSTRKKVRRRKKYFPPYHWF